MKTFKINGIDYTKYFSHRNWKLEYQPVTGSNSGKMLDGTIFDDEIKLNAVITLSCMPLDESQAATLLDELLRKVYPVVYYYDLRTGAYREVEMRRKISSATYWGTCVGGDYWGGMTVTLTER